MGAKTGISWTDHTFNAWWGCAKVSPACDHCYAERDAARFRPGQKLWGVDADRLLFGDKHWNEPLRWNEAARKAGADHSVIMRPRVFTNSMADVFDNHPKVAESRERLFDLIARTPYLDWLILTKRVGNVRRLTPTAWRDLLPANVWLGISVVNQEEADRDVPKLLALPARVRFLSCEPLLGPINLSMRTDRVELPRRLDWVIVGGESGPNARPMNPEWARAIRDQCQAARVAFHFKQWGEFAPTTRTMAEVAESKEKHVLVSRRGPGSGPFFPADVVDRVGKKAAGRLLDGRTWDEFPRSAP